MKFSGKVLQSATYGYVEAYHSKTGPRVRFLLALPHSLKCREICLDCPEIYGKWAQFPASCFQTGPEKVLPCAPPAVVSVLFSVRHLSSPVSRAASDEWNAIIN